MPAKRSRSATRSAAKKRRSASRSIVAKVEGAPTFGEFRTMHKGQKKTMAELSALYKEKYGVKESAVVVVAAKRAPAKRGSAAAGVVAVARVPSKKNWLPLAEEMAERRKGSWLPLAGEEGTVVVVQSPAKKLYGGVHLKRTECKARRERDMCNADAQCGWKEESVGGVKKGSCKNKN